MSTTVLAQIIGPVLLVASIGFLTNSFFTNPKLYTKLMKSFEENEGLTYFTGMLVMFMGLIIVVNHNIWEWSAAGIITIIGWGAILKGTIFLVFPKLLYKISGPIIKNGIAMKIAMVAWLVGGAYISYFGYFV